MILAKWHQFWNWEYVMQIGEGSLVLIFFYCHDCCYCRCHIIIVVQYQSIKGILEWNFIYLVGANLQELSRLSRYLNKNSVKVGRNTWILDGLFIFFSSSLRWWSIRDEARVIITGRIPQNLLHWNWALASNLVHHEYIRVGESECQKVFNVEARGLATELSQIAKSVFFNTFK